MATMDPSPKVARPKIGPYSAGTRMTVKEFDVTPAARFVSSNKRDALRDYEQKRDEYLAAGVKEYWIINRFRRIMTVYRPGISGPTYDIVTEAQSYQTELLPGFALTLAKLLAKADVWSRAKRGRRSLETKPTPPSGGTDG
jgi:hypothetical protein